MKVVDFTEEFIAGADGQQGKDYLLENAGALPDMIFVDLHMNIMNGWEFLAWFEDWSDTENISIPVYALSSSLSREDYERAHIFKKVMGYIIKPLTADQLSDIISKYAVNKNYI